MDALNHNIFGKQLLYNTMLYNYFLCRYYNQTTLSLNLLILDSNILKEVTDSTQGFSTISSV